MSNLHVNTVTHNFRSDTPSMFGYAEPAVRVTFGMVGCPHSAGRAGRTLPQSAPGRPPSVYPYDATYVKAYQKDGRVVSAEVVIAVAVNGETGQREVLGLDGGSSAEGCSGRLSCACLSSTVSRGETG
jgi:hypothetical protein